MIVVYRNPISCLVRNDEIHTLMVEIDCVGCGDAD